MLLPSIVLILGLACLVWSANLFVSGSASAARHMGMSPVMIGLTIVALGTSAPEIIVSADAAWNGAPDLGIGNAIGSNIANIGLVLGATALFATIPVASSLLRRELPVLLLVTVAAGACLWDHYVSFIEGVILLSSTGLVLGTLIWGAWKNYRGEIVLGDIIKAIDGQPVANNDDYLSFMEKRRPGDEVLISTLLNGEERKYRVRLAEPQ